MAGSSSAASTPASSGDSLPAAAGVEAVALDARDEPIGQQCPFGRSVGSSHGHSAQSGGAGQPGVGPPARLQLPDSSVRVTPALRDGVGRSLRGAPSGSVENVEPVRGREKQQCFSECVELELVADMVARSHLRRPWVAGDLEPALLGNASALTGVGRCQQGPVLQEPVPDKSHGTFEQIAPTGRRYRVAGEALVTDPRVAVVIVTPLVGAFGQRRRGSGDHRAAGAGQTTQHRPRVLDIARRQAVRAAGNGGCPGILGPAPEATGIRELFSQREGRHLEHQIEVTPL